MEFLKREGCDYLSNFYRFELYDKDSYLITVDDGGFIFLNYSAFLQLKRGRIEDEDIYKKLCNVGVIIDENNFNNIVARTKRRYSFLENGTSLHILILTGRCNMNCSYCYASAKSIDSIKEENDMNLKTAKKTVEFILKSPSYAITIELQGGEILVNFDIVKEVILYAKELNKKYKKDLRFAFTSNFVLMTENIANWFISNNIPFCTSFDGPENVHDKNRFISDNKNNIQIGTYKKVKFWIERINEMYKERSMNKSVNALMTISKYSLPYYKEIIDEYINLGIYNLDVRAMTYVGNILDHDEFRYSSEEYLEFYEKSIAYIDKLNLKGDARKISERLRELYETKILEQRPAYHTEFESPCGAATGQMTYHNNGEIYTCNEAMGREEFKLGSVFEDSWVDIFKKKETQKAILNSMLENNFICDKCAYKPYCSTCMVENFYNYGKFNFYPKYSQKHETTIYQSRKIFDKILDGIKKEI